VPEWRHGRDRLDSSQDIRFEREGCAAQQQRALSHDLSGKGQRNERVEKVAHLLLVLHYRQATRFDSDIAASGLATLWPLIT
jgi:hypothetical protein